ncbi:hypothetical protein TWF481_006013 [Arthrobotrys musiformis]|uniref:Uncharacterized protein n=1 Tax=Arthrobotrys musiformis TaxID=47236 RepID=A0AAV9WGF5_9PEZI
MDALTATSLAQLIRAVALPPLATAQPHLPSQAPELAAEITQLIQKFAASPSPPYTGGARRDVPSEQLRHEVSLLVRCIVLDGESNQLAAPSAYKVVSVKGDVSFEGLVDAVTARLSFSKLPGRRLRSMQACDTDGVQIVIDGDVAVRYLLGMVGRGGGVKITVYAVDGRLSEGQWVESCTTGAEFDPSVTPIYDKHYRTPRSTSPSHEAGLDGSRDRAGERTPIHRWFSKDRSESPVAARVRELSREWESTPHSPSSSNRSSHLSSHRHTGSPSHHQPRSPVRSPRRYKASEETEMGVGDRGVEHGISSKSPIPFSILHPPPPQPHEDRPRFCALSISEAGKNKYTHRIVSQLRLRLSTVNKLQSGWNHLIHDLFPPKPSDQTTTNSSQLERQEGEYTIMMLFMRIKGRPEDRSFYDTSGDVGIILNPKAFMPGSFKWTERSGNLLLTFTTDPTFQVVDKNTDAAKDPYPTNSTNVSNHISFNTENVPQYRVDSSSFKAVTALLHSLRGGKGVDVVIEVPIGQLPPNPRGLMKYCYGAERDDGLGFERDVPFVVEREYAFEAGRGDRKYDGGRGFDRGERRGIPMRGVKRKGWGDGVTSDWKRRRG